MGGALGRSPVCFNFVSWGIIFSEGGGKGRGREGRKREEKGKEEGGEREEQEPFEICSVFFALGVAH